MKITVAGGTGHVGAVLVRALAGDGHQVVVLSRDPAARDGAGNPVVPWDARTVGAWAAEAIDGADVVVNLAGRSVNCRYSKANLAAMLGSRVESTRAVGEAIAGARRPPRVWLQMSTATIYAHRFDANNDEATGRIGGDEPDVPAYWRTSIDIARAWEKTLDEAPTPRTRKVALRTSMVMSPLRGSVFDVLSGLVRRGLGGAIAGGRQWISWIHERDFVRAVRFLIDREDLDGTVNVASPTPLPQREFMAALRRAWGVRVGLPATRWMLAIGALFMRTDTELVLKSRRVVPGRLRAAGFSFDFPEWLPAAEDLVARRRNL